MSRADRHEDGVAIGKYVFGHVLCQRWNYGREGNTE